MGIIQHVWRYITDDEGRRSQEISDSVSSVMQEDVHVKSTSLVLKEVRMQLTTTIKGLLRKCRGAVSVSLRQLAASCHE